MNKPFVPTDLNRPSVHTLWKRRAVAHAMVAIGVDPDLSASADRLWPDNITKAAVSAASMSGWGSQLVGAAMGEFMRSLAPSSAAARLIAAGYRVDMSGVGQISFPGLATAFPAPTFVAEGMPIPVIAGTTGAVTLGPPKKLAAISGLTEELREVTGEAAETIVETALRDSAALALDAAMFSDAAAADERPAGIFYGVTPTTATTGGGFNAMVKDLQTLVGKVADAGAGSGTIIFANPRQAEAIDLLSPGYSREVVPVASMAAGTVAAVDAGAFVSGFEGLPIVDASRDAAIHWNATPANIGTAGSPNVVAAPVLSGFQSRVIALRSILKCAWALRRPGAVQLITGTTW